MIGNVSPLLASRSDNQNSRPFGVLEAVRLTENASLDEIQVVIRAAYRQVFGNIHIMNSERLVVAESKLKHGTISVREFIRLLAKSDLYQTYFFESCSRYRSIELNFKHLLGRAPDAYTETFEHSRILDTEGFEAEINSYLDSHEYQEAFGESVVPYNRGYNSQTGRNLLGFVNNFKLYKTASTSDRAGQEGNKARLQGTLFHNTASGRPPVTDIKQLISQALVGNGTTSAVATASSSSPRQTNVKAWQQNSEQDQAIQALRQQLADVELLSNFGSQLLSPWQTNQIDSKPSPTQSQTDEISQLQSQLMAANSLAAIAESRLNKWRAKTFS